MRRFLILGHTQRTAPPLPLNDPSGAGGRWDLLARCVTSGLLVSHGVRPDSQVHLALSGAGRPRLVIFDGASIRRLNPDERSTVALASKALEITDVGEHEQSPLPGVRVSGRGLERALADAAAMGPVVHLTEEATTDIEGWDRPGDATWVLSDHLDPTPQELALIDQYATARVSLGPVSLQADQCIIVVHNRLDRLAKKK